MKKTYKLLTVLMCLILALTPVSALASEPTESAAESTVESTAAQEETESAETKEQETEEQTAKSTSKEESESQEETEEETTPAAADDDKSEMSASEVVTAMIAAIDPNSPDEQMVKDAREAYDKLSMAQKMQVEGVDKLIAAEEKLPSAETSTEEPVTEENNNMPDSDQKSGTKYTFYISSYLPQVTLFLRYQTDANGDGKMDVPTTKITAPSGQSFYIDKAKTMTENDNCRIEVIMTPAYTQLDIAWAKEGAWTVETSNRVVFAITDYSGNTPVQTFEEIPDNPDNPQKEGEANLNGLVPLILLPIGIVALFIFIKKNPFGKKKEPGETAPGKTSKPKEYDPTIPQPLTPEQELQKIKEEWASMKDQYTDDEPVKPKKEQKVETEDDRLTVSQEDLNEDEGAEVLDDDAFFGNRFL